MNRDLATPNRAYLGYAASLAAACGYGSSTVIGREIVGELAPPLVATAFSLIFGMLIVTTIFHRHVFEDMALAPGRAWLMAALAGLASSWGVTFWFLALSEAPVVLVSPLVGVSPLVSILLAYLFLSRIERVTTRTILGGMLVVAGVIVISLAKG